MTSGLSPKGRLEEHEGETADRPRVSFDNPKRHPVLIVGTRYSQSCQALVQLITSLQTAFSLGQPKGAIFDLAIEKLQQH